MTINSYVKDWCDENYDVRNEDFFVTNAYFVIEKAWYKGIIKHSIFALLVSVSTALILGGGFKSEAINFIVTLGICLLSFWLYGIRAYDANSPESGTALYFFSGLFLLISKNKCPDLIVIIMSMAVSTFFIYLYFIKLKKYKEIESEMKAKIDEEESRIDQEAQQAYKKHANRYENSRYGIPENVAEDGDPMLIEAKKLFYGYSDNKSTLKARYRQLAKTYHPDMGGDTRLFQCIIQVYNEINEIL